jgi:hypothetical protein
MANELRQATHSADFVVLGAYGSTIGKSAEGNGDEMKLIARHRHRRSKAPRISISQAEITADLLYPVTPRSVRERGHADARRTGR